MNVNGGTRNAVPIDESVESELSRSVRFLIAAMNATDRDKLGEHRAYQEALHLFRVCVPSSCVTVERRIAIRKPEEA